MFTSTKVLHGIYIEPHAIQPVYLAYEWFNMYMCRTFFSEDLKHDSSCQ